MITLSFFLFLLFLSLTYFFFFQIPLPSTFSCKEEQLAYEAFSQLFAMHRQQTVAALVKKQFQINSTTNIEKEDTKIKEDICRDISYTLEKMELEKTNGQMKKRDCACTIL